MKKALPHHSPVSVKLFLAILWFLSLAGVTPAANVSAYSDTSERPPFLAWPLPTYIGIARISQFPNTPWTWNYLGLNPEQQCPPAFGYLLDVNWWPIWRDKSIPEKQDMARADPHNFEMVNCYSTLGQAGENGHEGTDIKAPAGTPVYASADGKVAGTILNNAISAIILKHCLNGQWSANTECAGGTEWYTTYMHIHPTRELLELGKDVTEGMQVGTIYNQGDNSHLHYEVGLEQRMYTNYVNPWGRDAVPWYGCMWKDQSLCVPPPPGYKRMGIFTTSDRFFVRDAAANIREVFGAEEIKQFQIADHRMAVIDRNGDLLIRDVQSKRRLPFGHEFLRNWVNLGNDFSSFQITGNRVGTLGMDGIFRLKEGDLRSDWILQEANVHSFSISAHRVGVLRNDGTLMIKEGSLTGGWLTMASNVKAFQLSDTRIAVVDLPGTLYVQEGETNGEWKPMGTKVQAFQLAGTRVAIVDEGGNLLVNDGNLRAEYVQQAAGVQHFQLADNRIVILDRDGKWKIKEGDLYQVWKDISGLTIKKIMLNGELPVILE